MDKPKIKITPLTQVEQDKAIDEILSDKTLYKAVENLSNIEIEHARQGMTKKASTLPDLEKNDFITNHPLGGCLKGTPEGEKLFRCNLVVLRRMNPICEICLKKPPSVNITRCQNCHLSTYCKDSNACSFIFNKIHPKFCCDKNAPLESFSLYKIQEFK